MTTAASSQTCLTETYHDWLTASIDEQGAGLPHALIAREGAGLTVMALDLPPDQIYRLMLAEWEKQPLELIFGIDRFAKPGQGTTLDDLVAGWHFTRDRPIPFIVEYRHAPRVVGPIAYDNFWWNAALTRELTAHVRAQLGVAAAP